MQYSFDEIVIDLASRSLTRGGKAMRVEPKVFDVLVYLIQHRDRMVTREELQEKCWDGLFVSSGTLSRCLSRVRSIVGQERGQDTPIQTMHRKGYRFAGAVEDTPGQADIDAPDRSAVDESAPVSAAQPDPEPVVERRPVTLVDILVTPATEQLRQDPEAAYSALQRYSKVMERTAKRFGGDLVDTGDGHLSIRLGLMGLGEKAGHAGALAAFDLLTAARQLDLQAQIVITTQIAIVETRGPTRRTVFGLEDADARLRAADAEPGTIVADAETARQARSIGIVTSVASDNRERYHIEPLDAPASISRDAEFFGRYGELEHLAQIWRTVPRKGGRVVMVTGDPGIGKTRLVEEFIERSEVSDGAVIQLRCLPYYSLTPFYPFLVALRERLRISSDTPPLRQLAAVEEMLSKLDGTEDAELPLLASLLSIDPLGNDASRLRLATGRQREQTKAAMMQIIKAAARLQPILLWVEDVQWSDPSTRETLAALSEELSSTNILLLLTLRSSDEDPFPVDDAARLCLRPFTLAETRRLIEIEAERGAGVVPSGMTDEIAARSGGVPLFITEFLSTVRSGDGLTSDLPVPTTLQSVLLARLDQAGPAKQIVQWASVCGQEFDPALLRAAMGVPEEQYDSCLERLVEMGLLDRIGETSEARHRFHTDLLRESAYGSMLLTDRQARHRAIAATLIAEYPKLAAEEPATVALHLDAASDPEAAAHYWRLAGRATATLGAPNEAAALLKQARNALDRAGTPNRDTDELSREIDDLLSGL